MQEFLRCIAISFELLHHPRHSQLFKLLTIQMFLHASSHLLDCFSPSHLSQLLKLQDSHKLLQYLYTLL